MTHVIAIYFQAHPEVGAVLLFLTALALNVVVGALLHLTRLGDFDWHRLGAFVEEDLVSSRGAAILVTFLLTLATSTVPGADWRAAYAPAFATLAASCAAATLPLLRDTLYEFIQLLTGTHPLGAVARTKPVPPYPRS